MFAGKKSAQIREILISESAWEEMTCLFAPSLTVVPSIFSEEKHTSRSERYTYIPTITLLNKLREEGFQPYFACQSKVRNDDKRGHTKHMVRLRREGNNQGKEVPEIILLNSHDGSSSYQMIPGIFRFVCTKEGANKQVISSQADSLIKISRIWADFFPANTSNQPI
ncbi:Domain of uncharacterised function (DUF932) [Klebsiella pneumoniae]|nr:Domain of uncharacterised function (DUF932) [Klebsiella pneumoniae]